MTSTPYRILSPPGIGKGTGAAIVPLLQTEVVFSVKILHYREGEV